MRPWRHRHLRRSQRVSAAARLPLPSLCRVGVSNQQSRCRTSAPPSPFQVAQKETRPPAPLAAALLSPPGLSAGVHSSPTSASAEGGGGRGRGSTSQPAELTLRQMDFLSIRLRHQTASDFVPFFKEAFLIRAAFMSDCLPRCGRYGRPSVSRSVCPSVGRPCDQAAATATCSSE